MQLEFHIPSIEDAHWLIPMLNAESIPMCDYSFTNLVCWNHSYMTRVANLGNRAAIRVGLGNGYLWPAGTGDPRPAIQILTEDAQKRGEPFRLYSISQYHRNLLDSLYPHRFQFHQLRNGFDYVYNINRLADLPGKKLHSKRNHIHRFDELCPGWVSSPITDQDIPDCIEMDRQWFEYAKQRESGDSLLSLNDEHLSLQSALKNRHNLSIVGIILRWNEKTIGFSLGSKLTDTVMDVHFERAWDNIQGSYAAVNRSFARHVRDMYPEIRYLDREEDMGIEGLRKAKLSYRPDYLQVKYCAEDISTLV